MNLQDEVFPASYSFVFWGVSFLAKKESPGAQCQNSQDFMGRCREGAVVLAGGEVVKVSNDKDIQLSGQGGMDVSRLGVPQNGLSIMENPIKMG